MPIPQIHMGLGPASTSVQEAIFFFLRNRSLGARGEGAELVGAGREEVLGQERTI